MKKIFAISLICLMSLGACTDKNSGTKAGSSEKPKGEVMEKDGIQIEVLNQGEGEVAKSGNKVSVHYTGWLTDGKKFDSSVDRGQPFSFNLGSGQVIAGWDIGVEGMKIGEKRKLTIPADKAYGNRDVGNGLIPAGSTLVFEVELLGVAN